MKKTEHIIIRSPLGPLRLEASEKGLSSLKFKPGSKVSSPSNSNVGMILKKCKSQLDEYFSGDRKTFKLKLDLEGTEFQLAVWNSLTKIKFGETQSYSWQGESIGKPKSSRAVGNANGKNPLPIIIPCHRVIQKSGNLGGYTGGLHIKKHLLKLEGHSV